MKDLEKRARELRKGVLDLASKTGEAHLGGSFSEIEILISLYDVILKENDKFILSKGHAYYPLYLLLKEKGYSPKLAGHPDIDSKNGINCTTGSLGHGLPIGVGMALARKKEGREGRIYVLMSDGECQEGTTWESLQIASHHKLDNIITIIDYNKFQAIDKVEDVCSLGNLRKKFEAFGCEVDEINGHCFNEIINSLKKSSCYKPRVIIADTIKGKGVSYMEGQASWHARMPTEEELKLAYNELK